jgi:hypothetical protein
MENRPAPHSNSAARGVISPGITRESWNEWLARAENIIKATYAIKQSSGKQAF